MSEFIVSLNNTVPLIVSRTRGAQLKGHCYAEVVVMNCDPIHYLSLQLLSDDWLS